MSCFVSLDRYASMCRWSIGLLAADEARLYVRVFVCLFCCCLWVGGREGCRMYRYLGMFVWRYVWMCICFFMFFSCWWVFGCVYVFFIWVGIFYVGMFAWLYTLLKTVYKSSNLHWHRAISDRKRKVILGHKSEPRCADTCTEFPFKNPNEQR